MVRRAASRVGAALGTACPRRGPVSFCQAPSVFARRPMDRIPMTRRGYEQAKAKLDRLKNIELPRLEKSLGDALDLGDISESSEVETARHEIDLAKTQLMDLEDRIARADIVDGANLDSISIGAHVKVLDL